MLIAEWKATHLLIYCKEAATRLQRHLHIHINQRQLLLLGSPCDRDFRSNESKVSSSGEGNEEDSQWLEEEEEGGEE